METNFSWIFVYQMYKMKSKIAFKQTYRTDVQHFDAVTHTIAQFSIKW